MNAWAIAVLLAAGTTEPVLPPPAANEAVDFGADKSQRMTVPVSIDGQGPFNFVVDTGAERTVLSEELANTLGLGRTGTAEVHSISGAQRFQTVTVPSLSVTSTPVRNVQAPLLKRGKAMLLIPTTLQDVAGGSVPAEIAVVNDMRLGSVTLTGMPIAFADLPVFRQLGLDKRPAMLLGMNTLRAFNQVAVDFATKKVRFVVPGDSSREDATQLASAR